MSATFDKLIDLLEDARKSATLENAGFGFDQERIEIKKVHFSSAAGAVGEEVHPTEYIKRMVKLHHSSWIIGPLDQAIAMLKNNRELIERAERLRKAMQQAGIEELAELSRGGMKGGA